MPKDDARTYKRYRAVLGDWKGPIRGGQEQARKDAIAQALKIKAIAVEQVTVRIRRTSRYEEVREDAAVPEKAG